MFNSILARDAIISWIKDYFAKNGADCVAVVGISGGKDSSTVAALCVAALGKERVVGVLMPQWQQSDIDVARAVVANLDIKNLTINVGAAVDALKDALSPAFGELSRQSIVNIPARVRMTTLYAVAANLNGRVANTCNLSEDWVGYSTKFGDSAGDFSPLSNYTVSEVKEIARALTLPSIFVDKVPIDGLSGMTDEQNLGFSYDVLDRYIRSGVCEDSATKSRIDALHAQNMHKLVPMPTAPLVD